MNNFDSIKESIGFLKEEHENRIYILQQKISILYNAMRFIFSIIVHLNDKKEKEKGFYQELISKKISSELDKNYIPGNFPNFNLKIKTFYEVKTTIKRDPQKYGAIICTCGSINIFQFSSIISPRYLLYFEVCSRHFCREHTHFLS